MTKIDGQGAGRAAVVGGSIAGCAAATALLQAGWQVMVFERSASALGERGFGIGVPWSFYTHLLDGGFVCPDTPALHTRFRAWIRATDAAPVGWEEFWRQEADIATCSWAQLWTGLRRNVPDAVYRPASAVDAVRADSSGVRLFGGDGEFGLFDLVIGADGTRSLVRPQVAARPPYYAGYVVVRGLLDTAAVAGFPEVETVLAEGIATLVSAGGEVTFFRIPDGDGFRVYWAHFTRAPEHLDPRTELRNGSSGAAAWGRAATAVALPAQWSELVRRTGDVAVWPILESVADRYVADRLVLLGDAATLARGSGGRKAIEDALCLRDCLSAGGDLDSALADYDRQRRPAGNGLVRFGAWVGEHQLQRMPDWGAMTGADMSNWLSALYSDYQQYLRFHPDLAADVAR